MHVVMHYVVYVSTVLKVNASPSSLPHIMYSLFINEEESDDFKPDSFDN